MFVIVDLSCRSRLANLNDRLNYLEKKVDYIEASVSVFFGLIYPPVIVRPVCMLYLFIFPVG